MADAYASILSNLDIKWQQLISIKGPNFVEIVDDTQ